MIVGSESGEETSGDDDLFPDARLRDEAHLLSALHHRSIVQVLDLVEIRERLALVTEYIEGADLYQVLREDHELVDVVRVRGELVVHELHLREERLVLLEVPLAQHKPTTTIEGLSSEKSRTVRLGISCKHHRAQRPWEPRPPG